MNYAITSKLELNLSDPSVPIPFATDLASKNRMAAIVIYDSALVVPLIQQRMTSNARWKIILALDFPFGARYVLEKFKQLPKEFSMSNVDGFDILLSAKKAGNVAPTDIEIRNEVQILRKFVLDFNKQLEVRFVVDILSRPFSIVEPALKAFKTNPPTYIRLDHNLEMPATKVNEETITKAITTIKNHTPAPIKISTNVDLNLINKYDNITRFDVTTKRAQEIVRDVKTQTAAK